MNRSYRKDIKLAASQFGKEEEYWLKQLSGDLMLSYFSRDKKAGDNGKRWVDSVKTQFTGELFSQLMKLRGGSDPRLYMILAAGLVVVLGKYTGNTDIIIGAPIYKQEREGRFINTVLALRNHIHEQMTFKELLLQVRKTVIEADEHQNYPMEILLEKLGMEFSSNGFPLFNTAILLTNIHDKSYFKPIHPDTVFSFTHSRESLDVELQYNASIYHRSTGERLVKHLEAVLRQALTHIDTKVLQLDMLSGDEKKQLLVDFNDSRKPYPTTQTVPQLFEEQAERTPGHTAVIGRELGAAPSVTGRVCQVSYRELNEKSDRLAHVLRQKGVKPDTIVGLKVERSIEMIIGLLGIIKAGGAYLPIDPEYPRERIDYMLADSNAKILLVASTVNEFSSSASTLTSTCKVSPANLAYIIYTSGTTGGPKGVVVRHQGVVNFVVYHHRVFDTGVPCRMSQVASQGFDAMAFEVWPCLLKGAALYITPGEIRIDPEKTKEWLTRNRISVSFQSTAMALELLNLEWPQTGVSLKALLTAGDRLTQYPHHSFPFRLYNLYGPTEDTVWTTWAEVPVIKDKEIDRLPPIGRPIDNHRVYILGRDLQLQPIGVAGELCISGIGLARGYLNRPELTAEKFVLAHSSWLIADRRENKVSSSGALPMSYELSAMSYFYKTGDLARWLPDGNIEFLGRIDYQVKLRGFRIELGEIESQLLTEEGIKEAVVIDRVDEYGEKYLCAYIAANQGQAVDKSQLRDELSTRLPEYMVPAFIVQLDAIPLTTTGKVDRRKLPEPEIISGKEYTAPRDDVEKKLVEIWSRLLKREKETIGIDTNFFEIGGNSLKITTLVSRIQSEFRVKLSVLEAFKSLTIRKLARYIPNEKMNNAKLVAGDERLVLLKDAGSEGAVNIFFIHEVTGQTEAYIELSSHINIPLNCYGIRVDSSGRNTYVPGKTGVDDFAGQYIDVIKKIQPDGPYYIAGYSIGGVIAFEIARQLEQNKEEVKFLGLIDAPGPSKVIREKVIQYSLEDELQGIDQWLSSMEIEEKLAVPLKEKLSQLSDLSQVWPLIVDYFAENNIPPDRIRKIVPAYVASLIPNFDQMGIKELIGYQTAIRSVSTAVNLYIPAGKVDTRVHFFIPAERENHEEIQNWTDFCSTPILDHEVAGNHVSMMLPPDVSRIALQLENILSPI